MRLKYFALPTELPPEVCSDSREDRTRTCDTSAPCIEVSQHIAVCCICFFVKQAGIAWVVCCNYQLALRSNPMHGRLLVCLEKKVVLCGCPPNGLTYVTRMTGVEPIRRNPYIEVTQNTWHLLSLYLLKRAVWQE